MTLSDSTTVPPDLPFWVSVVIPIHNGEADLPDLVDCLWQQTFPGDRVEYLLVDNNSGDRTMDVLQQLAQASGDREIRLHPLSEVQIQSSYAARNAGIKASQGEIIAFTDADCRPQPDWLARLVAPFLDETVGMVAGEVAALASENWLERYAERGETLSQKHTLAHPFLPYGQTANLAVRRRVFTQVGLFRPYLTTGGDADLCWRIQQQTDWRLQFAEQAVVNHRHRATLDELRRQWKRYGQSNRYLHELHGVELMRDLTFREILYRWSRWLLKEAPITAIRIVKGTASADMLLDTPLALVCAAARSSGQRQASLSDRAHQIEPWPQAVSSLPIDSTR